MTSYGPIAPPDTPDPSFPGTTPTPKRAPGVWHALARLSVPVGASITLHAAIITGLVIAAWQHRGGSGVGQARSEVVINLATPPEQQQQTPDPSQGAEIVRQVPAESILPQLQGLSVQSPAAPPTLRSGASESVSPGDLMRADGAATGATFAGLGARRAESVVYVVDASGAMVSSLKFIFAELDRSVRGLSSAQRFAVVLFRDRADTGSKYELFVPPGGEPARVTLSQANATNKAALSRWLASVRPAGKSNPLDGLRCGLAFKPDVVFLLSRSIRRSAGDPAGDVGVWGRGKAETLAELDRLNARALNGQRGAVIKAIQFLEEDPTGTMQAIGDEHGDGPGSYSVLTLRALGAEAK